MPGLGRPLQLAALALAALLAGCTTQKPPRPTPIVEVAPQSETERWVQIATTEDHSRIQRLDAAWEAALAEARRRNAADVRREGVLLDPKAALARPAPTPGSYNCRMVRLGKADSTSRQPAFERFKPFFCYVEVEGDLLTIVKQTGSQRPAGRLWEDNDDQRLIFLGSLALANEEQPLAYGDDPKRDMAGVFQRIAPFRWRLVIPWPQGPSKLDVFELTPVADQPE